MSVNEVNVKVTGNIHIPHGPESQVENLETLTAFSQYFYYIYTSHGLRPVGICVLHLIPLKSNYKCNMTLVIITHKYCALYS